MKHAFTLATLLVLNLMAIGVQGATSPKMPTFFARRDYPNLFNNYLQVADTNGDGIPDMISTQNGIMHVEFGNGDGTFRVGPVSIPSPSAECFLTLDLNRDGKADLVLIGGGGVVIAFGNGDGTFQPGITYSISDALHQSLVVGDFNGDGIPDIAAPGTSGVWLLTGKGGGSFNAAVLAVSLTNAYAMAAGDLNADGKLDLVASVVSASSGGGFDILFGNGDGTFQTPQNFSQPNRALAIVIGSLTAGGPPSIALNQTSSNAVYLYFGNGKGSFSGPKVINLPGGSSNGLALGDMNGDGIPDLVSDFGYVAYGKGGGNFSAPISYTIDPYPEISNVVLADLRNNGLTDILTGGYNAVSVLLSEGKGSFESGIWTSVAGGAGCGAKADFNGDGKPDLAVDTSTGISILLGTGKTTTPFQTGASIAVSGAGCLVTADINKDGIPDLLVPVGGAIPSVQAYLGNGDGTFRLAGTTSTPSGGYVAVADFNHDGKLDFATSGNLLALGNGDGTFQAPTAFVVSPPSGGYSGIVAGDINKDGWPDLVLTSNVFPTNATVTVLMNNHQGGFIQVATNFGALTQSPILVDLNADGNLDLVVLSSGAAVVALGDGRGDFRSNLSLASPIPGVGPSYLFVADVNGDGLPDVGVSSVDTLSIFLGAGNATFAPQFSIGIGPSPGMILVENLHGQTAAGIPDIVAPDLTGGVMVLLNLTQ